MKIKRYRWLIVALLLVITTINYLDRQIIGLLKPVLEVEFGWSETDFAHIIMAFTAAYAIGLLALGRFIDRVGTKIGYSVSVILWSIAGMLHAVAKSVTGFAFARIGLGIGEAGNFPAAMKTVSEWFPQKERALATGIFNSGTSVGVVAALFLTPWILSHYGWRGVFWITGGLGLIWLIFWLIFYEIPTRQKRVTQEELELIHSGQSEETISEETKIGWLRLFSFPQTWAVIMGKMFIDPIFWFFLFWLPSYFATHFALDLTRPSVELMIVYTATTVGSIGGGYFSSWLIKRGFPALRARKMTLLLFAFLEISIIFAQYAASVWIAVALISVAVAVHQAWATNVFTLAADLFPKKVVGSVVGIAGMAGAVGGIFFPALVGYLLDHYKAQGDAVVGYNILFTICGLTYLTVWLIIHLLTRKGKKIEIDSVGVSNIN
ncbi:MAG: MFS transporter [Tannerella sp.]|jgi:ACS family hexuronate transporter-like MFS transporter|nr:MFS transporter [Tannerella sp.]